MSGRIAEAEAHLRQAINLDPASADGHARLARVLLARGNTSEALRLARISVAIAPEFALGHNVLGVVLLEIEQTDDAAWVEFRKAATLDPGLFTARFNLSLSELVRGNYAEGFLLHESRFDAYRQAGSLDQIVAPNLREILEGLPRWQGDSLAGQRLLVWEEQGYGDMLMILRYLPLLAERHLASLTIGCSPALAPLVRAMPALASLRVIDQRTAQSEDFDIHCPAMSLPHCFGTRLETIPSTMPYLAVSGDASRRWQDRLASLRGFKVGLVWSGNPGNPSDAQRSLALAQLAPLFSVAGTCFVSLQKPAGAIGQASGGSAWPLHDWMDECADFLDTASLIANLDLVIAVDTSVAHLAGALGRPVWLLNRRNTDWRWLLDREDSPWYPTMRIFRQHRRGEWDDVIRQVTQALSKQVSG